MGRRSCGSGGTTTRSTSRCARCRCRCYPDPDPDPSPSPSPKPNRNPTLNPNPSPNPCQALLLPRGSSSLVAPPPDAVIIQSFHVVLRLQRRLATPPPVLTIPPLPRWRLGLRLSPALNVRLSATQYCLLRSLAATLQPPRPTPTYDAPPYSPSCSPPTPTTTPTTPRPPRAPPHLVRAASAGVPPLGAASERRAPPPLSRQGSSRVSQGSAASLEETIETISAWIATASHASAPLMRDFSGPLMRAATAATAAFAEPSGPRTATTAASPPPRAAALPPDAAEAQLFVSVPEVSLTLRFVPHAEQEEHGLIKVPPPPRRTTAPPLRTRAAPPHLRRPFNPTAAPPLPLPPPPP